MHLLLIGCTGFIGRELIDRFSRSGHELIIVSRNAAKSIDIDSSSENIRLLQLDPGTKECWENESLLKALAHSEGVINLAGEPIAEKRWTEEHLAIIQQSRLKTTEYLLEAMKLSKATPKVMINGSAIGLLIYFSYFVLRNSIKDESKKGKISSVYNILAFSMLIPLIFILPRLTDSLHPGNGGNPGFNVYDLNSQLRIVFYPAVIGFILLGVWIADLRIRILKLKNKL